jgi:GTP cyclohydrolase I
LAEKLYITQRMVHDRAGDIAEQLEQEYTFQTDPVRIYGVPRGGVPVALAVAGHGRGAITVVDSPEKAQVLIDDLTDSGTTKNHYLAHYPASRFIPLFNKKDGDDRWYVFPWEGEAGSDVSGPGDIVRRLLQYVGEDPDREGLQDTPDRVMRAWDEWTWGYRQEPADVLKAFEDGGERYDELVLVKDIPIYSQCEHHLAPFFGVAHIGYIPNGRVVGLSKLARLAEVYARRLQVQERLTQQIANALAAHLQPIGVGVVLECRHMCMESRGVQRQGATTKTSALLGQLREDSRARSEFFDLVKG